MKSFSVAGWLTLIIPALGRLRWEHGKFEIIFGFIASFNLVQDTGDLVSKKKKRGRKEGKERQTPLASALLIKA